MVEGASTINGESGNKDVRMAHRAAMTRLRSSSSDTDAGEKEVEKTRHLYPVEASLDPDNVKFNAKHKGRFQCARLR